VRCPRCGYDDGRTLQSSRLLHALLQAYARQTGTALPDVKLIMKYRHGVWVPVSDVTPDVKLPWRGQPVWMFAGTSHEAFIVLKSEADYTKDEEAALIDGVVQDCIESGIDIDDIMEGT
jgi:hypothetical protein